MMQATVGSLCNYGIPTAACIIAVSGRLDASLRFLDGYLHYWTATCIIAVSKRLPASLQYLNGYLHNYGFWTATCIIAVSKRLRV
jgi:hypothetical protein